jgi:probable rRNA maturation factor
MTTPEIDVQTAPEVDASPRAASLRRWARAALESIGESGSLCIRVVGADEMADLNARYRNKQGTTNVLSFTADFVAPNGGERLLGDVVICAPVVATEAAQQGKAEADHFAHLVVHGVLHLCGYDHENAADAQVMERREVAILSALGIDDPYR